MQKSFANSEPQGEALVRGIEGELCLSSRRIRIGIFDSGLGGLTVVQDISKVIKGAELFYVADTLHAPYGEKTQQQILDYSLSITQYLIDTYQIDALVVACNTATSAAIRYLRERYPNLILLGTEPAIKPAIEQTNTGEIGILATPATLRGDKYQALVDTLVNHKSVTLHEQACPGLVEHIENDTLQSEASKKLLEEWLAPMREAKVDTIVLGCTHYPLASEAIRRCMQREIVCIDSGRAIARHLLELVTKKLGHHNEGKLNIHLFYTGKISASLVDEILQEYETLEAIEITNQ